MDYNTLKKGNVVASLIHGLAGWLEQSPEEILGALEAQDMLEHFEVKLIQAELETPSNG